ncbi:hypothetical protein AAKU55_003073 [Oxalobacteraceae bacterium GrIS 1.11]
MKTAIGIFALAALLVSAGVQANCRSADAAKVGGDAGFARDQAAAMQTAEKNNLNSDALGKCISGITSIQVVPAFPSLMDIFNAAATKMCKLASDAIPHGTTSAPVTGASAAAGTAPAPAVPAGTDAARSPAETPARTSDFWSRIWR